MGSDIHEKLAIFLDENISVYHARCTGEALAPGIRSSANGYRERTYCTTAIPTRATRTTYRSIKSDCSFYAIRLFIYSPGPHNSPDSRLLLDSTCIWTGA